MRINIDNNSSLPNYLQIIYQIKEMILNGSLKPDDQLPSIRQLAKDLNIAIITIKRAYEELEKEHIVYTVSGKGVYINNIDISIIKEDITNNISHEFKEIIKQAHKFNIDNQELLAIFKEELTNGN